MKKTKRAAGRAPGETVSRASGAGRKKIPTPCPLCRIKFGVAELRTHLTACRRGR